MPDFHGGSIRLHVSTGLRYMIAAAFMFSLMSLFVKLAGRRLPSQQIVLVRSLVTLAYSYAALRWYGRSVWGHDRWGLLLRGVVGFAALSCVYYGLTRLPLAEATVIQYTHPVFTALLAALLLEESMHRGEVIGLLLSLSGVVLIARPALLFGSHAAALDLTAVGVALLGAIGSAGSYVIVRKLRRTEHPLVIVFYFPLVSTLGALPTALPDALWPTPLEWVILVLGIGLTAQLGQLFLTRGLHLERAGRATAVSYLQIIFAALWGVLFLHEYPDLLSVAGALLVMGGTLLTARTRAPEEAPVREAETTAAPASALQEPARRPVPPPPPRDP